MFIAASSLGTAQRAMDLALDHARKRVTFGKPIAERQAVQRYLAEMAVDVYALRHMLLDAARKRDAGQRIPLESSLCKLFGLEAVGRVTDRALCWSRAASGTPGAAPSNVFIATPGSTGLKKGRRPSTI